jgi:hypothetical protein
MRVRHRIPSIFNLSMVDVLCCALGCVILLWLINLREAKEHEDAAADESRQTAALLAAAQADRDDAYEWLTGLAGQLDGLEKDRAALRRQLAEAEGKWKAAAANVLALEKDREKQGARIAELEESMKTAAGRARSLEDDLRAGDKRYQAELARAAELLKRLESADKLAKELQATADRMPELTADLKAARKRAAEEEAMARALEKEIAKRLQELAEANKKAEAAQLGKGSLERELDARDRELMAARDYKQKWAASAERVTSLERQVAALQDDRQALRAAAENRFAGIQLTGKRVVFLVDTSGSMDLLALKVPAPNKWGDVCQTVARLMRSLPELEKFQVIRFDEKVSYVLGGDGGWLDYDPRTSPERVVKALREIKPDGGTDMYAALEAAFRLRPKGLDTIYLLSDGLPNVGAGLPPEDPLKPLTEVEKGDILSRHIRRMLKTTWNAERVAQPKVRINAVGFFYESPDVGAFLWALARENDGSFVGMSKP